MIKVDTRSSLSINNQGDTRTRLISDEKQSEVTAFHFINWPASWLLYSMSLSLRKLLPYVAPLWAKRLQAPAQRLQV